MALRGVWQLKEIVLYYSRDAGSSRGIREFVQHDLVQFAKENPQIKISTSLRRSHPNVEGQYAFLFVCDLVNGYKRRLSLRNFDREKIMARFMYLRNSLGFKMVPHNRISVGVIHRQRISVQGFWHNSRGYFHRPSPQAVEIFEKRMSTVGLQSIVRDLGFAGVIRMTQKLLDAQRTAREKALAALPVPVRTPATE